MSKIDVKYEWKFSEIGGHGKALHVLIMSKIRHENNNLDLLVRIVDSAKIFGPEGKKPLF